MEYAQARFIADSVVARLMPVCERVCIAGGIRRKKKECHDIDIVLIPRRDQEKNMFGDVIGYPVCNEFIETVNQWTKIKGSPDGKYTQRLLKEGITLELSIVTPKNWGNLLMIRTGNADFTHMMMKRALKCGFVQEDGYLFSDGKLIPLPEEEDYFKVLNLPFIHPENRDADAFKTRLPTR